MSGDTLTLAQMLISRRSLTPRDDGCQKLLENRLKALGFQIEKLNFGDVENLWARRGTNNRWCALRGTRMSFPQDL